MSEKRSPPSGARRGLGVPASCAALAVAVALAASPRAARPDVRATPLEGPAPRRPEHGRGVGAIVYATAGRAYLDVGAADGLAVGATVVARRGGETVARCAVDLVSEHEASCPAATLRAGDAIAFQAGPEPPEAKILPAVLSDEDLGRRAAALQAAPEAALVEFKAAAPQEGAPEPTVQRARWLSAEASWAEWNSTGATGRGAATVDLGISGADLGHGVLLDVAARAERWEPTANPRFRPSDPTRFYLWQAELTAPLSRVTVSAGRVLPYGIPGATVFDGASVSTRAGPAEIGAFGGVVPQPDTTAPTSDRATGGAFWNLSHVFQGGAGVRQDGRIAVVRSPELGTRFEASVGVATWFKEAYLSAEGQIGAGGAVQAPALVDAARADLTLHLSPGISVGGGFHHTGLVWPDPAGSLEPAIFPGRSDAGDGWVSWDVWFFRVGGRGGYSRDGVSKLDRSWFGPELGVPRLLGRFGGLTAGYLEERGWLPGRSAWAQLTVHPGTRFSFLARGTWTYASNATVYANEVGGAASASAELGHGLGLRASVLARTAVADSAAGGSTPAGVTGLVGLYGAY